MNGIKYVYVAGPITGEGHVAHNVRNAVHVGDVLFRCGYTPFIPHLDVFWNMVYPKPNESWLKWDFAWLEKCDALFRLSGVSPGADLEHAKKLGIPVFYDLSELIGKKVESEFEQEFEKNV